MHSCFTDATQMNPQPLRMQMHRPRLHDIKSRNARAVRFFNLTLGEALSVWRLLRCLFAAFKTSRTLGRLRFRPRDLPNGEPWRAEAIGVS